MPDLRILNIVNENDEIVDEATRTEIHQNGLLHRETHVWFYTPKGEIIFQHRAKDKDTYPDLLDATVGGHVEIGQTYEETAVKETEEETGVTLSIKDLLPLKKIKRRSEDLVTNTINNAFKMEYAYLYKGDIKDLRIEVGKILSFEAVPIEKLGHLTEEEGKRFVPLLLESEFQGIFKEIRKLTRT